MFQNINIEVEDIEENVEQEKISKKEILKENFKPQNVILYILAFGVAGIGFGERNCAICTGVFSSVV